MPQNAPLSAAALPSTLDQALDLLACPACLHPLVAAPQTLACTQCRRLYPVLDGIPILLVDRATLPG